MERLNDGSIFKAAYYDGLNFVRANASEVPKVILDAYSKTHGTGAIVNMTTGNIVSQMGAVDHKLPAIGAIFTAGIISLAAVARKHNLADVVKKLCRK